MQSSRGPRARAILDKAGFAYLEVSGGGCFDSAVRRGVESPWERIRAIRARCSTPLGMALRGRFLVGSRPLSRDLVRRFVASAAESGIDIFRIHDPLNDLGEPPGRGGGDPRGGEELAVGLVHSPGPGGETEVLLERANHLGSSAPHASSSTIPPGRSTPARRASSSSASARRAGCPSACTAREPAARRSRRSIEAARAVRR